MAVWIDGLKEYARAVRGWSTQSQPERLPSTAVNWTGHPIPGSVEERHPIKEATATHRDITNTKPTLFILLVVPGQLGNVDQRDHKILTADKS